MSPSKTRSKTATKFEKINKKPTEKCNLKHELGTSLMKVAQEAMASYPLDKIATIPSDKEAVERMIDAIDSPQEMFTEKDFRLPRLSICFLRDLAQILKFYSFDSEISEELDIT